MNTTVDEGIALARAVCAAVAATDRVEVAVLPPFTHLWAIHSVLEGTGVRLGAQDVYWKDAGAFTGEISPAMLAGWCDLALVGHSERRHIFGERDDEVGKKFVAALAHGLQVILAVGETSDERDDGRTFDVVDRQLDAVFAELARSAGDGRLGDRLRAGVGDRDRSHRDAGAGAGGCRAHQAPCACTLPRRLAASPLRRQRHRRPTPRRCSAKPDIDGALVGGVSLRAEEFGVIVAAAEAAARARDARLAARHERGTSLRARHPRRLGIQRWTRTATPLPRHARPSSTRSRAGAPHTTVDASGEAVGLPPGQQGNSEVGHLTIGAGRLIYQPLSRIHRAIADGSFYENAAMCAAVDRARDRGSALHCLGLISPGGVHSHQDHAVAVAELARRRGLNAVWFHAFLDGRDEPPTSAAGFVHSLRRAAARASESGRSRRFPAGTSRWTGTGAGTARSERTTSSRARVTAPPPTRSPTSGRSTPRASPTNSSPPVSILHEGRRVRIEDGDSIIFFNFRPDRARQLSHALVDADFDGFSRSRVLRDVDLVTFTEYERDLDAAGGIPARGRAAHARRGGQRRGAAPVPRRRDREVRARHVLHQRRARGRVRRRGAPARPVAAGARPTTPFLR